MEYEGREATGLSRPLSASHGRWPRRLDAAVEKRIGAAVDTIYLKREKPTVKRLFGEVRRLSADGRRLFDVVALLSRGRHAGLSLVSNHCDGGRRRMRFPGRRPPTDPTRLARCLSRLAAGRGAREGRTTLAGRAGRRNSPTEQCGGRDQGDPAVATLQRGHADRRDAERPALCRGQSRRRVTRPPFRQQRVPVLSGAVSRNPAPSVPRNWRQPMPKQRQSAAAARWPRVETQ
jgi:hypothetical protein